MSAIFDALPGIEVPVGSISKSLAGMWADTAAKGGPAPEADEFKATQVNFVLHLGFSSTPTDAAEQFQTAVRFSHRYPCRVVVLCPLSEKEKAPTELKAKVYGECFLGKSKGDTRCCEFVMLSYPMAARQYLESQVSVCLSTDLPLYYWAHRFSSSAKLNDYQYLLRRSRRVMFDSAIVPIDALTFPWPQPEAVRDLVYARLLPVRQSIGQFLSAFAPESIVDGLKSICVAHKSELAAEARVLTAWTLERLVNCGAPKSLPTSTRLLEASEPGSICLRFEYSNGHRFLWQGDLAQNNALLEADFGSGTASLPTPFTLLGPEASLGEAMFF